MRFITADHIFENGHFVKDRVILCREDGKIHDVINHADIEEESKVEYHRGALIPGLVNTHCHLELSHMRGLVETGTGLLPFLKKVVQFRDFKQEVIDEAIEAADREMWTNGIVAVGDISNKTDTRSCKERSSIAYYTFIEMFDFLQESMTLGVIKQYEEVFEGQSASGKNKKTMVPHSPYTVSPALFDYISKRTKTGETISIHNQETKAENDLFLSKHGGFLKFYSDFGFNLDHFEATGKTSIHRILEQLNPLAKTLLVHNTQTSDEDITAASAWSENVYYATCPNANLYIENTLPNYRTFLQHGARMTIGTDSLTSNWQLNILEEIATIQKFASYIPLETTLIWATKNGAEALGYEQWAGEFVSGKSPGVNLVQIEKKGEDFRLCSTAVKKII